MNTVWQTFTSAPHRVYFLAGAIQGVLAMAWWFYDLAAKLASLFVYASWAIPSIWAHSFLMLYGFFPFFIFGFLMTAAPNWVNGQKVLRAHYLPSLLLMAAGIVLFYPALLTGRWLVEIAIAIYLAGWMIGGLALLGMVIKSPAKNKIHAYTVVGSVFVGWLGAAAFLLWLFTNSQGWLHLSVTGGIWLFLLPIIVSVSHRMIPFFTSTVLPGYQAQRPYLPLVVLLVGMASHAALELNGSTNLLWLADLPMAAMAIYLSVLWRSWRCFGVRLLAMLHVGFAWLGIALALYGVQSLVQFVQADYVLGFAPLHALTIGYFSSMVLAMVTRVTLGHSGRQLSADTITWFLFLAFQFAALFRILGDLPVVDVAIPYLLAALAWLVCFALWGIKYIPVYLQPRVDGKPG